MCGSSFLVPYFSYLPEVQSMMRRQIVTSLYFTGYTNLKKFPYADNGTSAYNFSPSFPCTSAAILRKACSLNRSNGATILFPPPFCNGKTRRIKTPRRTNTGTNRQHASRAKLLFQLLFFPTPVVYLCSCFDFALYSYSVVTFSVHEIEVICIIN